MSGIVRDERSNEVFGAEVVLEPRRADARSRRPQILVMHGTSNERGFFQFVSVPEGEYNLVSQKKDYSTTSVPDVEVTGSTELWQDLVQRPLQSVDVLITPPVDALQRPWTAVLSPRYSREVSSTAAHAAEVTGHWTSSGLAAGEYLLEVKDADGTTRANEPLQLTDGDNNSVISITSIEVRGRVHAGDRGFPSTLRFRQRTGITVSATTGPSGEFQQVLPAGGSWRTTIVAADRSLAIDRTTQIDPAETAQKGYVWLDISLDGGRIDGEVVTDEGQMVNSGSVHVLRDHYEIGQARIGDDGKFAMLGLPAGTVAVYAQVPSIGESEQESVDVGKETVSKKLVVHSLRPVTGVVTSPVGYPVAGAIVRVFSPAFASAYEAITGPDGGFRVRIPPTQQYLTVIVLPGEFPAKLLNFAGTQLPKQLDLRLSGIGGTVHVSPTPGSWPAISLAGGPLVSSLSLLYPFDGSPYPRGFTRTGLALRVEAGHYTVCSQNLSDCQSVDVGPGSDVALKLEWKKP
ncbi:MAG: carboxypeptidase-like regulatory domain-containing protein [Acidobacteriota bacterium]